MLADFGDYIVMLPHSLLQDVGDIRKHTKDPQRQKLQIHFSASKQPVCLYPLYRLILPVGTLILMSIFHSSWVVFYQQKFLEIHFFRRLGLICHCKQRLFSFFFTVTENGGRIRTDLELILGHTQLIYLVLKYDTFFAKCIDASLMQVTISRCYLRQIIPCCETAPSTALLNHQYMQCDHIQCFVCALHLC